MGEGVGWACLASGVTGADVGGEAGVVGSAVGDAVAGAARSTRWAGEGMETE